MQPKCCQDPAKWGLSLWWQNEESSLTSLHTEVDEDYLSTQLIKYYSAGSIPEYKKKVMPSQITEVLSVFKQIKKK